jgi:nitrogen fixation/metabolism regulation signal transduction histidine kinase
MGHYFEPYMTTKSKGTGLGLAIVKKIVEEHGGMVTAENLPDQGAVITIRLPVMTAIEENPAPGFRADTKDHS